MKNFYIILILFFSFAIFSCGKKSDTSSSTSSTSSSTEGYTRGSMPSETTVSLPGTLTTKASSSRTAYASLSNSLGLLQMQNSVLFMKLFLSEAEVNMVLMDAAISQSKMSVGNCYATGEVEVTFTEEMLQALKNVFSKLDSEMSSSELTTYSSLVNTQISNSDFALSYLTTTNRGFDKVLTMGNTNSTCSGTAVSSIDAVMMWTDNGNKLQYTFDFGSSSQIFFGTLAYDGSTKTSSFDFYLKTSSVDFYYGGIFTVCNSGVADCVTARVIMGSDDIKLESRGKADDNGGYAMSKYISGASNFWVTEHWDSTLKSQMYAYPCSNASWDNVSNCNFNLDLLNASYGETSSSSGLTSYETDAGKLFSQNWIATPGKSSSFLADSVGQGYALMTTPGSTNIENLGGAAVKLDNSTVGFVVYFEPTSGDNLTMQDLGASGSNSRDISSTAVDNLTLTY
jgi:hypothetical protein